jgi:hypothetical protein
MMCLHVLVVVVVVVVVVAAGGGAADVDDIMKQRFLSII